MRCPEYCRYDSSCFRCILEFLQHSSVVFPQEGYFSEEILSTRSVNKSIKISDRAAIFDFMVGLNGYTISSGMYPAYFLSGRKIISIPLDVDEVINIGIIYHTGAFLFPEIQSMYRSRV